MTNSKKIIIVATIIHLAAIVYGIIRGLWDAVILAIVLLVASLLYSFNKDKSPDPLKHSQQKTVTL
jgi:predicted neutral ceramidase superfamily lipid hydrolase